MIDLPPSLLQPPRESDPTNDLGPEVVSALPQFSPSQKKAAFCARELSGNPKVAKDHASVFMVLKGNGWLKRTHQSENQGFLFVNVKI